jgi:hypothetical protein
MDTEDVHDVPNDTRKTSSSALPRDDSFSVCVLDVVASLLYVEVCVDDRCQNRRAEKYQEMLVLPKKQPNLQEGC